MKTLNFTELLKKAFESLRQFCQELGDIERYRPQSLTPIRIPATANSRSNWHNTHP